MIVYEDPSGTGRAPDSAMEIWRTTVVLGEGGFQEVDADGCPSLNPMGAADADFFVAVANRAGRSFTLGVDQSGPYSEGAFISVDGGLSFEPIASMPVIDGNVMIRALVAPVAPCFIDAVR